LAGERASQEPVRWWSMRRAQNRKPATYRCPFCGRPIDADGHICPRANGYRRHLPE